MAKYDELTELIAKYFKERRGKGITGTKVAKVITKKDLHKFPSLSGKMNNPFANRNFSMPHITRERRYYKFKEFEDDIVKDLTKMVKYVNDNDITLGEKLLANLQYNLDLVKQLRRFNKESEDIFIKAGKNPEEIILKESKVPAPHDEPLVDSAQGLAESGRRLQEALKELEESAKAMRSFDDAEEVAKRAERYSRLNEGKGFGIDKGEAYNRAVARKLALMLDEQGVIKLDPKVKKGLKEGLDMTGGHTELEYVDPIRVIREHMGDDIFDQFPKDLVDTDIYTKNPKKLNDFIKLIKLTDDLGPKKVEGGKAIDYITPKEYQQRIVDLEESIPLIEKGGGFWTSPEDIQHAIKQVHQDIKTLKDARADAYPEKISRAQDIIEGEGIMKEADPALVKERREGLKVVDRISDDQMVQDLVDTQIYSKAEIDYMVELRGPESIGDLWRHHVSKGHIIPGKGDIKTGAKGKTMDNTLQEKMFDGLIDQWKKQGFTEDELRFALQDITTDMPADEAYALMKKRALEIDAKKSKSTVKDKTIEETLNDALGGTASKPKSKKDTLSIRLIKHFDKELDDIELAQEGYNLQEIDVLKKARNIMKTEDQNPTEALRWVRGELADEAGEEIDDFMTDFPWDDQYAEGGRVGFSEGGDLYQKRAEELALEIFGVEDFFRLTDRIQDALYNRAKNEIEGKIEKAHGGRVGFKEGMSLDQILEMVNTKHGLGSLKLATDPSVVTNPNPGIANREMWNKFNRWYSEVD